MFTDADYLKLYILLAILANIIALILRTYLRKSQDNSDEKSPYLNAYEIAYVAGGLQRAIDTAITNLVQHGYLQVHPKTRSLNLKATLPEDSHLLEKQISLAVRFNGSINQIRTSVARATFPIYKRLVDLGVVISLDKSRNVQLFSALPIFALLLVGMGMIIVSILQGKSIGFLVLLWMITAMIGCSFMVVPVRRSLYGDRILEDLHATHVNSTQNSTSNSTAANSQLIRAFALFGVKSLANSALSDLRQVLVSRLSFNRKQRLWQWLNYTAALF